MKQFLAALDCRSRAIWWHLYCRGHADIAGMTAAAGLDSEMEVLLAIRRVINPAAVAILGEPAVEFASCRIDQGTGEKIYYQWWLNPVFLPPAAGQPLVDIIETGSELVLIVDPGSRPVSVNPEVTCRNGIIMIRFDRLEDR